MAKLSNINGRFAVEDDGAIQFNGQAGTSGYVLESRGASSPPVWTDRDTGNVTGSGTLNKVPRWTATGSNLGDGPITFATNDSTFAGKVTTDKIFVAKGQNVAHVASSIIISQENTTKSQIRFYGADTSTAGILEFTGSSSDGSAGGVRFTINADGSSTFSGNVTAVRGFFNSGATNVVATFTSTDGTATIQCADDSGNVEFGASGNNFVVQPAGGVAQLTVGASSSTFAGNVGIGITPSASFSGLEVLQLGKGMTIFGNTNDDRATMAANLIVNTGTAFEYVMDGLAGRFSIEDGNMVWGTAPTGSAGATATVTTRMTLLNTGNVGIGTTSPGAKLQVANAGEVIVRSSMTAADGYRGGFEADNQHTGGTIWSMFSTNNSDGYFGGGKYVIANESMGGVDANTTAKFVIDGSGNVGIEVTDPDAKLEIKGTGATTGLTFKTTDSSGNTGFWAQDGGATGVHYYPLLVNHDYDDTPASSCIFHAKGVTGVGLFVKYDGNVGIGTTSPAKKLDVARTATTFSGASTDEGAVIRLTNPSNWENGYDGNGFIGGIEFYSGDASESGPAVFGAIKQRMLTYYNDTAMCFFTSEYNGSLTERIRIQGNGNVGIGTTSPGYKLDVNGNIRSSTVTVYDGMGGSETGIGASSAGGYLRLYTGGVNRATIQSTAETMVLFGLTTTGNNYLQFKDSAGTSQGYVGYGSSSNNIFYFVQFKAAPFNFYLNGAVRGAISTAGTLTMQGDVIAYGSPSDKRLKENIKPIESALDKVSKLQGVTFDWKEKEKEYDQFGKPKKLQEWKNDIGFIAQDVQKVIPELVRENEDGMLSMRHQGIAPILLEAIKELKAEIEELKKQIK